MECVGTALMGGKDVLNRGECHIPLHGVCVAGLHSGSDEQHAKELGDVVLYSNRSDGQELKCSSQ